MVSDLISPQPVYVVEYPKTIGERVQWRRKINEEYDAAVQRGYKSTEHLAMKKHKKMLEKLSTRKNIKFDWLI